MPTSSAQSDVGAIRQLVVKHVREAWVSSDQIDRQWEGLNYASPPDLPRALYEYDQFIALLQRFEIDIRFLPADDRGGLDSLYVRDSSIMCDRGAILCNMGKAQRRCEPLAAEATFREMDISIHGAITGEGRVEGGDVAWIDERTLVVGRGYRTNDEGIGQLKQLLGDCVDELVVAPLPHWRGPGDVFHLMSILSPIDHDLALVYSPLMPVPLRETLLGRGMELVEVPDNEFDTMGCNVLAVAPRKCVMLDGNPITRSRLLDHGVEVFEFQGDEICRKGAGGPTCLTRPIRREIRS